MALIIKDKGWNRILKNLNKIDDSFVKIGLLGDAGSYDTGGGVNVAQVATWQEFGTTTIPARPFMRQTFEENRDKVSQLTLKMRNNIYSGSLAVDAGLKTLGVAYKGLIQKQIRNGNFAANAESTIRAKTVNGKKGTTPLINTGQMIGSVNFEVVLK